MSQAERRHERLAVRLSLIISRLVAGETLIMQKLAAEFGVSVRTLRRDFRERLAYLDLEFSDGQCRLLSGSRQRELAVQTFVRHSGVEALFPDIDNQLVTSLLSASESPCLIWHSANSRVLARPDVFTRLVRAITEHRRVTLLAEGGR
ncbi:DeoR family transcriptional regulator, partial [Pectobacterium versatile]|nr:DeoR family transcriptional regulator [Pectobacterium versatile]